MTAHEAVRTAADILVAAGFLVLAIAVLELVQKIP